METTDTLIHVEKFEDLGPDYARAWAAIVKTTAPTISMPCKVEVEGNTVTVTLTTPADYREFVALKDVGLFNRLVASQETARNMLRDLTL